MDRVTKVSKYVILYCIHVSEDVFCDEFANPSSTVVFREQELPAQLEILYVEHDSVNAYLVIKLPEK